MGNKSDAISQKRARNKGYYASDLSECKYKYGSAWWRAWMDGWRANKIHLKKRAADGAIVVRIRRNVTQGDIAIRFNDDEATPLMPSV